MAFEYKANSGVVRLTKQRQYWAIQFNGRRWGRWASPDAAATAAARHSTGLSDWDRTPSDVPDDILDWRPLGDSL
ncbi:MAG TPA: hypothetical protein VHX39_17500 [Acetobacteraceae bacterium]|jgi:hypothetical protein|nr:hypothetical protein [Acetobacteraceae bacterium]